MAHIVAKGESQADEIEKALLVVTKKANTEEPGTKTYRLSRDLKDPLKFIVYEEYADGAAFQAHEASDEFQSLFKRAGELISVFDVQFLRELHP